MYARHIKLRYWISAERGTLWSDHWSWLSLSSGPSLLLSSESLLSGTRFTVTWGILNITYFIFIKSKGLLWLTLLHCPLCGGCRCRGRSRDTGDWSPGQGHWGSPQSRCWGGSRRYPGSRPGSRSWSSNRRHSKSVTSTYTEKNKKINITILNIFSGVKSSVNCKYSNSVHSENLISWW